MSKITEISGLYTAEEVCEESGSTIPQLETWTGEGFIEAEGYTEEGEALYSSESLNAAVHLKKMTELGYDKIELKKIIKKIGFPGSSPKDTEKNRKNTKYLTVGTLSEKTGISPRTLKHWEEKGIIAPDLRSRGGFRMYRDYYVFLCSLIRDLQLFGYSLDEIKDISDYFRDFIAIENGTDSYSSNEKNERLLLMEEEISRLFIKTDELKKGIKRWEDLLRKKSKQITLLKNSTVKKNKSEENNEN